MRISVIGAGAVGSAVAQDLVSRGDVKRVLVCDNRSRALTRLGAVIKSPKLQPHQIDARDEASLAPLFAKSDCVIVALGGSRAADLARFAAQSGTHYCDLGGSESDVEAVLALDDVAKEAGTLIVPACGLAPGLVNILCVHGIKQFDQAVGAHIRVGDLPVDPQPPFDFAISWSAQKVLDDYTGPVRLIEDGVMKVRPALTGLEAVTFDEPFGTLEAFCTSGGLSRLPSLLEGQIQSLDLKTLRWPGHAERMRFLIGLGFAEQRSIDVRTHLTYRDLLIRRMQQRLGKPHDDAILMRLSINGMVDGKERTLRYQMVEHHDEDSGLSAMKRCTSIPAAVVAVQLASGKVSGAGAMPPEQVLSGADVLAAVRARGLSITETWNDGRTPVGHV